MGVEVVGLEVYVMTQVKPLEIKILGFKSAVRKTEQFEHRFKNKGINFKKQFKTAKRPIYVLNRFFELTIILTLLLL